MTLYFTLNPRFNQELPTDFPELDPIEEKDWALSQKWCIWEQVVNQGAVYSDNTRMISEIR